MFKLNGFSHKEIKKIFKLNSIIISSGKNSSKHLASPLDLRLIRFLSTLYDDINIEYDIITDSFHHSRFK